MPPEKLLWMPFYPADWKNDLQGSGCDPEVDGVWIRVVGFLWYDERNGTSTRLLRDFSEKFGVDPRKLRRIFEEISARNIGEITFHKDGKITVHCRRTARDLAKREQHRKDSAAYYARSKGRSEVGSEGRSEGTETRDYKEPLSKPQKRSGSKYSKEEQIDRAILEGYLNEIHIKEWGVGYTFDWGKDRTIMYRLIKKFSMNDIRGMVDLLVTWVKDSREKWITEFSLEVLEKKQHRLVQAVRKKRKETSEEEGLTYD